GADALVALAEHVAGERRRVVGRAEHDQGRVVTRGRARTGRRDRHRGLVGARAAREQLVAAGRAVVRIDRPDADVVVQEARLVRPGDDVLRPDEGDRRLSLVVVRVVLDGDLGAGGDGRRVGAVPLDAAAADVAVGRGGRLVALVDDDPARPVPVDVRL